MNGTIDSGLENPLTISFICGCGHTGTSLLANMFAAHRDVYVPLRETGAFLKERDAESRWMMLLRESSASGKSHFLEKTPRHIHKIDLIRSLVPTARFILTVRDGRDVAASFIKRYGDARKGIDRWLLESTLVRKELTRGDTVLMKYEDLIEHPEAELRRLSHFVGIPYDPGMLSYHQVQRLWFGADAIRRGSGAAGIEHVMLRAWQINQPIFDGRGAWKTLLQRSDLLAFESGIGRDLMDFFGYCHADLAQNITSIQDAI